METIAHSIELVFKNLILENFSITIEGIHGKPGVVIQNYGHFLFEFKTSPEGNMDHECFSRKADVRNESSEDNML